jgi:FkbH-like protein
VFEFDWAERGLLPFPGGSPAAPFPSGDVRRVAPLVWEEHCTECAIPDCYAECALYTRRADGACARFAGGIRPTAGGLVGPGGTIAFRRWGTLTSPVPRGLIPARAVRLVTAIDRHLGAAFRKLALWVPSSRLRSRLLWGYHRRRRIRLSRLGRRDGPVTGRQFFASVWNHGTGPVQLEFEYAHHDVALYRYAWELRPGPNSLRLPDSAPSFEAGDGMFLHVAPDEPGAELTFHALDFLALRDEASPREERRAKPTPARFVKCVAWDLDNTLWDGVLVESAPNDLRVRAGARELLKTLDERGIVQTVVSKNNYDDAWARIEALGLDGIFVFPSISWDPKSEQLKRVAADLNLGLDAFLLIDDSSFERAEVERALPGVRTADGDDLVSLRDRADLSPPVSVEGRTRRQRYAEESTRRSQAASYEDYTAFVADCDIRVELFPPRQAEDVERCVELIQRSNQLNLSGRRLSREEFDHATDGPGFTWLAGRCRDRFGDYGIVVVLGVRATGRSLELTDLCISCRVARRYVEHAIVQGLADRAGTWCREVRARIAITDKNEPLREVMAEVGFALEGEAADSVLARLALPAKIPNATLVSVLADEDLLPAPPVTSG